MAVCLALQENIKSVTIEENHVSGIGASHNAVYHCDKIERAFEQDITDVGNW